MENRSKTETYIGFAVRTGRYRVGVNAIATLKKVKLLIICHTAADNTMSEAKKLAKRFHVKLLTTTQRPLQEYIHRENAKLMAVLDKPLTNAITHNMGTELSEIIWERS